MYPQEKRLSRLRVEPLDRASLPPRRRAARAPPRRPARRRRHLVVIDGESLIEAKALLQHGRADERRRVPSLILQDLRQSAASRPARTLPYCGPYAPSDTRRSSCWRGMARSAAPAPRRFRTVPRRATRSRWGVSIRNSRSTPAGPARSVSMVTSRRFSRRGGWRAPDLQEPKKTRATDTAHPTCFLAAIRIRYHTTDFRL